MLKGLTIRASMTLVIAVFFAILIVVSAAGVGALKLSNDALREMYESDTSALVALKTSDALLQRARVSLDSYQALYGLGDPEPDLLTAARQNIAESDRAFERFVALQSRYPDSQAATHQLKDQRRAVLDKAVLPGLDALEHMSFSDFKALQGKDTQVLAQAYQASMTARENAVMDGQRARYADAQTRFKTMIAALAATSLVALAIGIFARAMLIGVVVRPVAQVMSHLRRIASGDLCGEVRIEHRNELGALLADVKTMQDALVDTVRSVRTSTESISGGAQEIASGSADLSRRTEQQAASLERTAASMEQLTSTVKRNADNADKASKQALHASDTAAAGGQVVSDVVRTMQGISIHSSKIAEIVGLIDSIAFQTNILALNAAVEAARAGELGRGFAVVASEVRSLAQRSAHAAKEIKQLIDDTVGKIAEGSALADRAGHTMTDIVVSVRSVSELMTEIFAAVREQSQGIEEVNLAVMQMDTTTQQNAALVEEATAAAKSLEEQAVALSHAVAVFKLDSGHALTETLPPLLPRPA
ncbi:HAMP domain-containing protein [Trinickia violacea]|uniref:HAMP domain-containing protein n=1 Tax=Trinickia violacea TaxID=2571746 RepID=A0A4P8IV25_9BURK|nr:methyl-accepting chemotaxis protein [Trinickia violacea]QCP52266.1 HAMP domain-containing protein [Trinickia violacea]